MIYSACRAGTQVSWLPSQVLFSLNQGIVFRILTVQESSKHYVNKLLKNQEHKSYFQANSDDEKLPNSIWRAAV